MKKLGYAAATAALLFGAPTYAQLSITVGNIELLPDTPNQAVEIFVTGGQQVEVLNFNIQIADGAGLDGPVFQEVDLIAGTIFDDPNNDGGQFDLLSDTQVFGSTVSTPFNIPPTSVAADGLLATVTIDTTGVFDGEFDLSLSGTLNGDTDFVLAGDFLPTVPGITNGVLTVIPEPTTAMLLLSSGGPLVLRRRRRAC